MAVALLPHRWRRPAVAAAIVLPVAIETLQGLVPLLGRTCATADVAINLLGLGVGVGSGLVAARATRRPVDRPRRGSTA